MTIGLRIAGHICMCLHAGGAAQAALGDNKKGAFDD